MKIAIDARMWNETGIGRYIRNLVLGLEKINLSDDFYILLLEPEYKSLDFRENFHKIKADFSWYGLTEQIKLPIILNKISPDIFHAPNINIPIFYSGKMLVTVHDLIMLKSYEYPSLKRKVKRVLLDLILKIGLRKAFKIVTVSEYVKNDVVNTFQIGSEKINVVYNSVEFSGSQVDKNTVVGDYILYVGNTYGHKNVEFLVRSIDKIGKKLVIVGKEDENIKRLKQLVQDKNLTGKVKFTGYVNDQELNRLYSEAYAFVFPTLDEGFGLPGLEAMYHGCPVVCSDIEVLREIYKDGSLYFEPNNLVELRTKLDLLSNNQYRAQMINKGYEIVAKYNNKKFIEETLKIYIKNASYK